MKTLESFDFGRQSARKSAYDWDSMLDGKIHVLEAGTDFTCKPQTFKSRLRAVAKKAGLSVKTGSTKEGNIVIQSYTPKDGDEFEAAKAGGKTKTAAEARSEKDVEEAPRRRKSA